MLGPGCSASARCTSLLASNKFFSEAAAAVEQAGGMPPDVAQLGRMLMPLWPPSGGGARRLNILPLSWWDAPTDKAARPSHDLCVYCRSAIRGNRGIGVTHAQRRLLDRVRHGLPRLAKQSLHSESSAAGEPPRRTRQRTLDPTELELLAQEDHGQASVLFHMVEGSGRAARRQRARGLPCGGWRTESERPGTRVQVERTDNSLDGPTPTCALRRPRRMVPPARR